MLEESLEGQGFFCSKIAGDMLSVHEALQAHIGALCVPGCAMELLRRATVSMR